MENFSIFLINQLKYLGLFFGSFLEGPLTGLFSGFLVKRGIFNFWLAYFIHLLGDFSADAIYYFAGFFNSKDVLKKLSKWFKFSFKKESKIGEIFLKHPIKTIFFGKLSHFLGLPVLIGSGLSKYSWQKFLFFNFLATAIKSFFLIGLGWYLAEQWQKAKNIFAYLNLAGTILLIIIVGYFLYKYIRKKIWIN